MAKAQTKGHGMERKNYLLAFADFVGIDSVATKMKFQPAWYFLFKISMLRFGLKNFSCRLPALSQSYLTSSFYHDCYWYNLAGKKE
ncbi:MAG: hypothetical protein ACPLY7_01570 [Microgenomates group bacterium]